MESLAVFNVSWSWLVQFSRTNNQITGKVKNEEEKLVAALVPSTQRDFWTWSGWFSLHTGQRSDCAKRHKHLQQLLNVKTNRAVMKCKHDLICPSGFHSVCCETWLLANRRKVQFHADPLLSLLQWAFSEKTGASAAIQCRHVQTAAVDSCVQHSAAWNIFCWPQFTESCAQTGC